MESRSNSMTTATRAPASGSTFWMEYGSRTIFHIPGRDRKSTRLNSSHGYISYAVFCLKKKRTLDRDHTDTGLGSRADHVPTMVLTGIFRDLHRVGVLRHVLVVDPITTAPCARGRVLVN